MKWTIEEEQEIEKFFKSNISQLTLYQRLYKINPARTYESISRHIRRIRDGGGIRAREEALSKLRVGYLDIEATNLNASFGHILSWVIKTQGKREFRHSIITKKEIFNYTFDKRVVEELLEAMSHYDIIYAHYGSDRRFDIPFIRTRAFRHGIEDKLPKQMEQFIMDTYPIARNKLRLHSNRLGAIAEILGVKDKKTPVSPLMWELAAVGHPEALGYVLEHNKKDVLVLEAVHKKLAMIEKVVYTSI